MLYAPHANLAAVVWQQRPRDPRVAEHLATALALDPGAPEAFALAAMLATAPAARAYFEREVERAAGPSDRAGGIRAALAIARGDHGLAAALLHGEAARDPAASLALALAELALGHATDARAALAQLPAGAATASRELARALVIVGTGGALIEVDAALDAAIQLDLDRGEAWFDRGVVHERAGVVATAPKVARAELAIARDAYRKAAAATGFAMAREATEQAARIDATLAGW